MEIKDWQKRALELRSQGLRSRAIAEQLLGRETAKSTVNDFFKRYDSLNDVVEKGNKPVTIFFDLESSLMLGYFFKLWDENISFRRVKKQSHLLSAAWAFDDEGVQGCRLTPEQVRDSDDLTIVVNMIEALNKADHMVTFNGKRFDVKLLNTRAIQWGLPPIKPIKHTDLFEQAKKVFKFPSNSMQNISMYLGEEGKLQTGGSDLWERCAEWENYQQCNNALEEMLLYNKQDIEATRDLYKRFQGWMKGIPNHGTMSNELSGNHTLRCTHCGSDSVFMIDGLSFTSANSFNLYRCGEDSCRGVSRITKNGKNLVGVV